MREGPDISQIGALIGDPARANILVALMDGRALTATELAEIAGVTAQTASTHLSKLAAGGLIRPQKQGRHKYFSLAGPKAGQLIESLSIFAADRGHLRHRPGPRDAAMRNTDTPLTRNTMSSECLENWPSAYMVPTSTATGTTS